MTDPARAEEPAKRPVRPSSRDDEPSDAFDAAGIAIALQAVLARQKRAVRRRRIALAAAVLALLALWGLGWLWL
jgi:hypothetical protein